MNIVPRTVMFTHAELPILHDYLEEVSFLSTKQWEQIKSQAIAGVEVCVDRLMSYETITFLVGKQMGKKQKHTDPYELSPIKEYFLKRGLFQGKQYHF